MSEKLTIPWGENGQHTREVDLHARFGPWAVTSSIDDGLRWYAVTHVPTGRKTWGNWGDGLACTACARELADTFPNADKWTSPPTVQTKEDGIRCREIVERHREHDAGEHAFD